MAQLPNSPPSALEPRPTGPVYNEGVAKIRVTTAGPSETYDFKGKTFEREGEMVSVSSLGWDNADVAAAEADPHLVIERFNKDGRLVKKNGKLYPTVGELTPKPLPKKED